MYTTSDKIFLPARWVSFEAYPKQILAWLSHLWIWSGTFLQTTSKKINRKNFVQHSWKNKHLSKNCQLHIMPISCWNYLVTCSCRIFVPSCILNRLNWMDMIWNLSSNYFLQPKKINTSNIRQKFQLLLYFTVRKINSS